MMILSMRMCVCVSGCYMSAGDYRDQKSAGKILEAGLGWLWALPDPVGARKKLRSSSNMPLATEPSLQTPKYKLLLIYFKNHFVVLIIQPRPLHKNIFDKKETYQGGKKVNL